MLTDNDNTEVLINRTSSPKKADNSGINNEVFPPPRDSLKPKKNKKKRETQFTTILKVFNILIGFLVVGFGVSCYKWFGEETSNLKIMGVLLPAYIAFSGLVILLVECNIGFIVRNMRFLYNFIGKGLFNIYVGIMPLALLRKSQDQTFQILIYTVVGLMCFVGLLYILAKVLCCAKENPEKKKNQKKKDSDSDSDSD